MAALYQTNADLRFKVSEMNLMAEPQSAKLQKVLREESLMLSFKQRPLLEIGVMCGFVQSTLSHFILRKNAAIMLQCRLSHA